MARADHAALDGDGLQQHAREMSGAVLVAGPPGDIEPVLHETRDRIITGLVTVLPVLALAVAAWQSWDGLLNVSDLIVFGALYVLTGLGVTVGFHRHLTHRSFKARPAVRAGLAVLGSAAIEGPVISWVADHRKHHAFSDRAGDPHSPHVDHGVGWSGALRGLLHAHVGWLFRHDQRGARARYAPDLLADPLIRFVDRTFVVWALGGLAVAFGMGVAIGGTIATGLTALLWGGGVRLFVLHHATYSINSICHVFGRRTFTTADQSRNVFWLALPSFGESWHNNHHAFPTSARHGLGRGQIDLSAIVIRGLEACGLAWDVVRVSPERRRRKTRTAAAPVAGASAGAGPAASQGPTDRTHSPGPLEVTIALDPRACGAARIFVAECLGSRVVASELESAQLIVSELVANSVQHSNSRDGAQLIISVELAPDWFRVGVHDPGLDGVIMVREPNLQSGGGFGLALVQTLSERWGVERLAGGTNVWARIARSALGALGETGTNGLPTPAPRAE